jgi:hypothetical protein
MAPFIGRSDGKHTINFSKGEIPNCQLEIEFKLTEAEGHVGDDSGDEEGKDNNHMSTASRDSRRFDDDIRAMKEEIAELKR